MPAIFHVTRFLHMSQLRVSVPKLGISSSKQYRKFKSSLISLMIVNNGEDKLFATCMFKSISSKGKRDIILQGSTLTLF